MLKNPYLATNHDIIGYKYRFLEKISDFPMIAGTKKGVVDFKHDPGIEMMGIIFWEL